MPALSELWGSLSLPAAKFASEEVDQPLDLGLRLEVLCVQIGWVLLPGNLANLKLPMPDSLLDPQTRVLQTAKLAKDFLATAPDRCGTVGP